MSAPCVHADPRRGVVTAWTGDEAALRRAVRLARVAGAVVLSINRPDAHGDERVRLTHWLMALVMRGLTGSSDAAAGGAGISAEVRRWAIEHGDDRALRIVLAGYEGEHVMPAGWRVVEWTALRGFGGAENSNRKRERLWLSPHCESARQPGLFGRGAA